MNECLRLGSPAEADSQIRIQGQVVYLEGDP